MDFPFWDLGRTWDLDSGLTNIPFDDEGACKYISWMNPIITYPNIMIPIIFSFYKTKCSITLLLARPLDWTPDSLMKTRFIFLGIGTYFWKLFFSPSHKSNISSRHISSKIFLLHFSKLVKFQWRKWHWQEIGQWKQASFLWILGVQEIDIFDL